MRTIVKKRAVVTVTFLVFFYSATSVMSVMYALDNVALGF